LAEEPEELDLAAALGAEAGYSTQCFALYVPNRDREGAESGTQHTWVFEALRLLAEVNGGATATPPLEGAWLSDTGAIVIENPVIVYSFVRTEAFLQGLPRIREFLHRMARETRQGEIAFTFDGQFFRILQFDNG